MVQRSEYLDFMLNRWSTESPLAKRFPCMDDFLVKLHNMRIVKTSGQNGQPARVPVLAPGGVPASLVQEDELGNLDKNEKAALHQEIVKDLFKWYDKDNTDAIDCNGLLALMSDLVSDGEVSLQETDNFMNIIDQDGDRLLQVNELVTYMMTRWGETAPKAARFNNDVGAFLSVVYPIVQRKLLARWCLERGVAEPPMRARRPPPPPPSRPAPSSVETEEKKKKKKKKKNLLKTRKRKMYLSIQLIVAIEYLFNFDFLPAICLKSSNNLARKHKFNAFVTAPDF